MSALKGQRLQLFALAASSGLLLGLSFPPSPLYTLAYVGFIPLLFVLERLTQAREVFRYGYVSMTVLHLVSLYSVGGFTHGNDPYLMISGFALVFGHPLFFVVPLLVFLLARRRLGSTAALVMFPFLWTAFEYSRSLTEFAFPWITLGNSQAYDLTRLQIAEYTSVYGLSALLVAFNVLGFVWLKKMASGSWTVPSRQSLLLLACMLCVYAVPWIYGKAVTVDAVALRAETGVRVGIVQPNIDPWEKWGQQGATKWISYNRQYATFLAETEKLLADSLDLVVWPETALPFDPMLSGNGQYLRGVETLARRGNVSIFTGMPTYVLKEPPIDSAARKFLVYNAATMISPDSVYPPYKKVVLVPFAERVPYADVLTFLVEPMRWGVGISGWDKGTQAMSYPLKTRSNVSTSFAGMICYESIFPWYVRDLVLSGGEFLVVITNDSWWGKTSGAYQHAAVAALRAVEHRRWIVRCANGGISGFIDPYGRYQAETALFSEARLAGVVRPESSLTFYGRHGDLFAQACSAATGAFLLVILFRSRGRRGQRG